MEQSWELSTTTVLRKKELNFEFYYAIIKIPFTFRKTKRKQEKICPKHLI